MQALMHGIVRGLAALLSLAICHAQDPAQQPQPQQQQQQQQQQQPAAQQPKPEEIRSEAESDRSSRLTLRLKDRDLREVVASIRKKANANIIIDPSIEATVTIDLQDVPWRSALTLVAEQARCIVSEADGGVLKVENPPKTTFSFENTDIQKVIDTIAKISGANIAVAPEVKGTVTVRLKNIPWRDALESVVKTLGYVVVEEKRGILRVVPPSNVQQDLVTETFQLRFARPNSTYVPFIQSTYIDDLRNRQPMQPGQTMFSLIDTLKQMLTPQVGTLDYVSEQNFVVVKDTRPVIDNIRRTLDLIDTEPAQIQLDIRFVTTTNEDVLDVGINPGGSGWTASLGLGQIPTNLPFNLGQGGWDDRLVANPTGDNSGQGRGPFADESLNAGETTVPNVVFGALNFQQVTATLRLLKRDTRSELVQAPQIVTLDHQPATIFVGEAIRYAQARVEQGQAGGLLLALEEGDESPVSIGFQLLTTPHVVPGTDKIVMQVIPQRTSLSGTGNSPLAPAGFDVFTIGSGGSEGVIALPRVASSTLSTTVLLRSGQTAVLGGLKTKTQSETITKLPLLGDIPVLGYLFKGKSRQDTMTTLLVFITPELIRSPEDVEKSMQRALEERLRDHSNIAQQREAIFGKGD
jgi:type II secretory pathway component GspD/PulD (secretin)